MEIVLVILAFFMLAAGFAGAIVPGIPGPPLSYAGLIALQLSGYAGFTAVFLIVWAGIAICVTVMDYFLPALLAKQFGGSRAAAIGSFVGLVAGVFIFPPFGMIIGPFLGAFIGELFNSFINSPQNAALNDTDESNRQSSDNGEVICITQSENLQNEQISRAPGAKAFIVALGAFLAFIVGTGAKLITGSLMIFYAIKTLL
jgi:uncharacterized protein YqgC (DUF456 family)